MKNTNLQVVKPIYYPAIQPNPYELTKESVMVGIKTVIGLKK